MLGTVRQNPSTERATAPSAEVSHWQVLREAYLEPLVADATKGGQALIEAKVRYLR